MTWKLGRNQAIQICKIMAEVLDDWQNILTSIFTFEYIFEVSENVDKTNIFLKLLNLYIG